MFSRVALLLGVLLLVAGTVTAAEIYGQLWVAPNDVPPSGALLTSSCGGEAQVDQYGRYRLTDLPLRATCALTVNYRNMPSNPVNIYTAENRNGANFMLRVTSNRLLLIRR